MNARDLLLAANAGEIEHPGGTLLAHLGRVEGLLAEWGARPALVAAGLCHAFYGTDGFKIALLDLDERDRLVSAIGAEAEEIVYFYASCDRQASYPGLARPDGRFHDRFNGTTCVPSLEQRRDFAELTAANELDLATVSPAFREQVGPKLLELFTAWQALLSGPAWKYCSDLLG